MDLDEFLDDSSSKKPKKGETDDSLAEFVAQSSGQSVKTKKKVLPSPNNNEITTITDRRWSNQKTTRGGS